MSTERPDAETQQDSQSEQTEEYSAVTWFEATNADTQAILLGRHEDGQTLEEEEVVDGSAVRVRRYYEPQEVIELPVTMDADAASEWIDANRDHEQFDGVDWDAHDEKSYLRAIVGTRNNYRGLLAHFEQDLRDLHVVGVEAQRELDQILEKMAEASYEGPAVSISRIEKPDGGEDE